MARNKKLNTKMPTFAEAFASSRNYLAREVHFRTGSGKHGKQGYTRKVKHTKEDF